MPQIATTIALGTPIFRSMSDRVAACCRTINKPLEIRCGVTRLPENCSKCRAPHLHRERYARFGNQLLGGLVQTNQRAIGIAWPCINGQHVFHRRYESAVGLRRDNPLLSPMRLENVFLSARPIVLSLARSTMSSSTTLVSNSRKVQRARLWEVWSTLGRSVWLPSHRQKSAPQQALPVACGSTRLRSLLPPVACAPGKTMETLVSRALMIRLSLHPSPASETSAFNNIRAFSSRCAGLFPFRISVSSRSRSSRLSLTTYFFTEISFAAMIASLASSGDESESPDPFKLVEASD